MGSLLLVKPLLKDVENNINAGNISPDKNESTTMYIFGGGFN